MPRLIYRVLLCLNILLVFAAAEVFGDQAVTITTINTDIDGKTRRNALLSELTIKEGKEYSSLEHLERILSARVTRLRQQRLFQVFSLDLLEVSAEEVEINIVIVDSPTFVPRPIIKYSTDRGITLGLKLEYFNAFGTLTDQMIQGYWSPNEIMFEADVSEINLGPLYMDVNVQQFDGAIRYGSSEGITLIEYRESRTQVSSLIEIPLGAGSPWSYQIEPLVSWRYDFRDYTNSTGLPTDYFTTPGFAPGLDHGIDTDQTAWIGNFRRGFKFNLKNTNLWYTQSGWSDIFMETDLMGYLPVTSWLELSGRYGGFYAFEGIRKNAGDRLRGVVDYMTWGDWGQYLSLQVNFKVFHIQRWFSLQLRPFTDIGYVASDLWSPGTDSWEYCLGATAIINIDAMPSLSINVDWGWDFKRSRSELIIDTKTFY